MTTIKRPVVRETLVLVRGRPLIVQLESHQLYIREKGRQSAFSVPYEAIYMTGCKIADRERRLEKQQAKRKGITR